MQLILRYRCKIDHSNHVFLIKLRATSNRRLNTANLAHKVYGSLVYRKQIATFAIPFFRNVARTKLADWLLNRVDLHWVRAWDTLINRILPATDKSARARR